MVSSCGTETHTHTLKLTVMSYSRKGITLSTVSLQMTHPCDHSSCYVDFGVMLLLFFILASILRSALIITISRHASLSADSEVTEKSCVNNHLWASSFSNNKKKLRHIFDYSIKH